MCLIQTNQQSEILIVSICMQLYAFREIFTQHLFLSMQTSQTSPDYVSIQSRFDTTPQFFIINSPLSISKTKTKTKNRKSETEQEFFGKTPLIVFKASKGIKIGFKF